MVTITNAQARKCLGVLMVWRRAIWASQKVDSPSVARHLDDFDSAIDYLRAGLKEAAQQAPSSATRQRSRAR